MNKDEIIRKLQSLENKKNISGMRRFGIASKKVLGIPNPVLRKMAQKIGKNHDLALELWESGINEARSLATLIEETKKTNKKQIERWVKDFDSWDVCDYTTGRVISRTKFAYKKVFEWAKRKKEYEKRAAFALIAGLTVHDKKAKDKEFERFFPLIKKAASDERNFVKKAVNWALRQIGKRNKSLNKKALAVARDILKMDSKSAKWIASDAIRELESKKFN